MIIIDQFELQLEMWKLEALQYETVGGRHVGNSSCDDEYSTHRLTGPKVPRPSSRSLDTVYTCQWVRMLEMQTFPVTKRGAIPAATQQTLLMSIPLGSCSGTER